jgi:uncharacterized damage-inducible protein DinB
VRTEEIRTLFAYDRWATDRVLARIAGIDETTWSAADVFDARGLGGILVHHLGASQRWRHGFLDDGETPRPERDPLPATDELVDSWREEWRSQDAWLASIDDAWLERDDEGVPFWLMLTHVVNHGTQHRSEAAALLTQAGRSPGELDLITFAEEGAGWVDGEPPSSLATRDQTGDRGSPDVTAGAGSIGSPRDPV